MSYKYDSYCMSNIIDRRMTFFQEENEILEVEVASMRDVCDGLEADIEKLKDENDRTSKKYKKRREKLKKLLILKGISEWNSSDDDSD